VPTGRLETDQYLYFLLRSGLWVVTGHDESMLSTSPELLDSPELRHQLTLKAVQQKMVPMLVAFLRGTGRDVSESLGALEGVYRVRMARLYAAIEPVLDMLEQSGIDVLMLKGSDLAFTGYPAHPEMPRVMFDVDLLAKPPDLLAVENALKAAGFAQGRPKFESLRIESLSPADVAAYKMMNHYELPAFQKFIEVAELTQYVDHTSKYLTPFGYKIQQLGGKTYFLVEVDVHFNISRDIELQDVWDEPRWIKLPSGREMLAQSLTNMLWFLATRLYHEVMQANGCVLRNFIDVLAVVNLSHDQLDWDRIVRLSEKYGLFTSLYYVFVHVNELLGPVIPQDVLQTFYPMHQGMRRDHDWGYLMPKLLGRVVTMPIM
jgi:hypothetical protein